MPLGNIRQGLLKQLVDLANELGPQNTFDSDRLTTMLKNPGYWTGKKAESPERTVNAYLSQNPKVFEHIGRNQYRLDPAFWSN